MHDTVDSNNTHTQYRIKETATSFGSWSSEHSPFSYIRRDVVYLAGFSISTFVPFHNLILLFQVQSGTPCILLPSHFQFPGRGTAGFGHRSDMSGSFSVISQHNFALFSV